MSETSDYLSAAVLPLLAKLAPQAAERVAPYIPRLFAALADGNSFIYLGRDEAQELAQAAPVVGSDAESPLVLDGRRLFLARHWQLERDLARQILRLRTRAAPPDNLPQLRALLQQWFADAGSRDQQAAAALTLLQNFMLVSGGPGTGKTTTVAKLLALLCQNGSLPRIALAAPTGKAAARMAQSLHQAVAKISGLDDAVRGHLSALQGQTVHRLLGLRPPQMQPVFHAGNPLPLDVLLLDEASMLDNGLLLQTLSALPDGCRVVLLGDADQLPSVGAGAVLEALSQGEALSPATAELLRELLPQGWQTELREHSARLAVSHRFDSGSGIGVLARAVVAGDGAAAERAFADFPEQLARREGSIDEMAAALYRTQEAYWQAVDAGEAAAVFEHYADAVVLCALRDEAAAFNRAYRRLLQAHGRADAEGWFAGQLLMISRNDPAQQLFNGDIGIVLPHQGVPAVWFADGARLRPVPPARLPEYDSAFAITVHKSQGSEYREVWLPLPAAAEQLPDRTLLYTALTRAKERFVCWNAALLAEAVHKQSRRHSALADFLRRDGKNRG